MRDHAVPVRREPVRGAWARYCAAPSGPPDLRLRRRRPAGLAPPSAAGGVGADLPPAGACFA
jgi:hypothetical protein